MARSGGIDAGDLIGPTLAVVRRLVALGFLEPAGAELAWTAVHPRTVKQIAAAEFKQRCLSILEPDRPRRHRDYEAGQASRQADSRPR